MKTWSVKYKEHEIRVDNGFFGERLIVDGEIQDEQQGFSIRSRLWGKIRSGEGRGEAIKVSLGGWLFINCSVFVDDKMVYPEA